MTTYTREELREFGDFMQTINIQNSGKYFLCKDQFVERIADILNQLAEAAPIYVGGVAAYRLPIKESK